GRIPRNRALAAPPGASAHYKTTESDSGEFRGDRVRFRRVRRPIAAYSCAAGAEHVMISSGAADEAQAYFRWKVVGAAFVLAVFGWGIGFYGPSVFLRTLHDERGWPIALVSAAITAHFLFSALFVAYLPEAYARWGLTRVTQTGIFCTAIGAMLWGNAAAAWQLFPIAAISGAGSAATTVRRSTRSSRRGSAMNGQRR